MSAAAAAPAAGYCAVCGIAAQMVCTGCRKMFYCDKKHQRQHWKTHKSVCTTLASATPAAAKQHSAKHVLLVHNCGSLGDWYSERLLKHKWLKDCSLGNDICSQCVTIYCSNEPLNAAPRKRRILRTA
jgi:MYND finger